MREDKTMNRGRFAVIILAALTASCADRISQTATGAAAEPVVTVTRVEWKRLNESVRLPGELSAYQDVALYPKVQSFVEAISVDRGSVVKRGDLLVRLSAPELQARTVQAEAQAHAAAAQKLEAGSRLLSIRDQKAEAEAKLAADAATYARLRAAAATPGVVAGNDLEIAQKTVEADRARVNSWVENEKAAQAQVQTAEENERSAIEAAHATGDIESYLRIAAPFDGVITERNVHVGSLVGPAGSPSSSAMLRIQQVSVLRLTVYVPEYEVSGILTGSIVKFTVPAYPGETFSGTVRRVAHAVEMKSRTMPVELDVANESRRLAPGMYAEVIWPFQRTTPTLFVPPSAIATTTERTFVNRIRNGTVERVDVKRGVNIGTQIEVYGDLSPGDLVALRGTDELRQGTRVKTRTQ